MCGVLKRSLPVIKEKLRLMWGRLPKLVVTVSFAVALFLIFTLGLKLAVALGIVGTVVVLAKK